MCFTDKGQATLSLGMDLNLDWMTLDDFQKHLNGEDEILSGPPLSPSECFLMTILVFRRLLLLVATSHEKTTTCLPSKLFVLSAVYQKHGEKRFYVCDCNKKNSVSTVGHIIFKEDL